MPAALRRPNPFRGPLLRSILPPPTRATSRALALALGLLVPASAVFADPPSQPGRRRPGDEFRFSPPVDAGTPTPAPTSARPTAAPKAPLDPIAAAVARLASWPGPEGLRAAETLVLIGTDAVDPLVRALDVGDPAARPGAAWVLGTLGGKEHVQVLLRAAAQRDNGSRVEVFFEAAKALDLALTRKWLFSYLQVLDRPVFRSRATEFLSTIATVEDRPQIENLLSSRLAPVRACGLELLSRVDPASARERLFKGLGDPHPDVARRAARLLSDTADEASLARANALAREGPARERAYAVLSLVDSARRLRENVFESATVRELTGRRGFLHPDALNQAASAIGLAYGAVEEADPAVAGLLDGPVVERLILIVGGDRFLDYGSVMEPCFAALRRVSGRDLPEASAAWAQWWVSARGSFHARRTLRTVTAEEEPRARVTIEFVDAEGRRRLASFSCEGADRADAHLVLPEPAFRALLHGLGDAGLLDGPDDARPLRTEGLAARVRLGAQDKRALWSPTADDARYETLRARFESLEEANLWQRYRDPADARDDATWRRETAARFADASAEERGSMLADLVVNAFAALPSDAARSEALETLGRSGVRYSDAQIVALLTWVSKSPTIGPVEERVVAIASDLMRPTLAEAMVETLARSTSPGARAPLARALSDAGAMRVREAFADPRPTVRAAATQAALLLLEGPLGRDATARERMADAFRGPLKSLLGDEDRAVRVRAATALARLGDETMIPRLEEMYGQADVGVRLEVTEGLGRIGGPAVRPLLLRVLAEIGPGSAPLRASALTALARGGDKDALRIVAYYMISDADESVQAAAEQALVAVRGEDAVEALADLLAGRPDASRRARIVRALAAFDGERARTLLSSHLEDPDLRVVDQAALGLARQGDAAAVPYLMAVLRRSEEPLRPRALEALEDLTCLVVPVASYDAAADQYQQWWHGHREAGDRSWFRDALTRRGYDVSTLDGYVVGKADLRAVPILLRAVRDDDPSVRRQADLALRRVTGTAFGAITRATTREEARRIADAWSTWWADGADARAPQGR